VAGRRLDSPDLIDLGPSSARPTFVVRIDIADLDGIDPSDPTPCVRLATGSDAAFGRLAAAGRLSSTPWLGRQLLDTLACNLDLLVAVVDGERPLAEFRRTTTAAGPDPPADPVARPRLPLALLPRTGRPLRRPPPRRRPTNHDVDNLLSLCRRHHRRLHSTFWHPRLDGHTGRFDLLRTPTGTPVHTTFPRGTNPRRLTAAAAAATAAAPSGGDPPEVG
jgi:hypothetical protein